MDEKSLRRSVRHAATSVDVSDNDSATAEIVGRARQTVRRQRFARAVVVGGVSLGALALTFGLWSGNPDADSQVALDRNVSAAAEPDAVTGRVVAEQRVSGAFRVWYSTLDELLNAPEADAVVTGRVVSVDYSYDPMDPWTKYTVAIDSTLSGATTAKQVDIWEEGGLFPVDEATRKQLGVPDGFVDAKVEGADHAAVGDRGLFVIWKNPDTRREPGSYVLVMSAYGRLMIDPTTGDFVRPTAPSQAIAEQKVSRSELQKLVGDITG